MRGARHREDLEKIYVRSDDGQRSCRSKPSRAGSEVLGPQSVNHINQFPSVTIFFNLVPGAVDRRRRRSSSKKPRRETLPPSVARQTPGRGTGVQGDDRAVCPILMIFAVFAMYVILGILYESYVHPITVLTALPVATVGGLATLLIFEQEASLYAYVGMFLLIGIVKKNGIMMIDFALQRMAEGMDRVAAVHEACMERFRPIMMTTFAALMGAVPLALGYGADGGSRQPLGPDHRRRPDRLAIHHALRHARAVPVSRSIPGKCARPLCFLPQPPREARRCPTRERASIRRMIFLPKTKHAARIEPMQKIAAAIVAIILLALVVVVITAIGTYNGLVGSSQEVDKQWAQVQSTYQPRADLIPNLVQTVQGAANFEKSTLTEITEARASVGQVKIDPNQAPIDPAQLEKYQAAQNQVSSALSRLLVVVERYPDLKANSNFRDLQAQLEGTENRINVARENFNEAVKDYNSRTRRFPTVLIAGALGFSPKPYFQATAGSEAPPKVNFDFGSPTKK